jgi:predicted O-linked N-acetylglucosamine transferase (SPINDLY family)
LSEAIDHLRAGLQHNPHDQTLESLLGATLWSSARVEECIGVCRASLARAPGHLPLLSLLANALNYAESATPEEILAAHRTYGAALMATLPPWSRVWNNSPDSERPLRVGLLSCDLKQHSVAYFVAPLIEHLRGPGINLTCYSTADKEDHISARLKAMCPAWVQASRLDDAALAERIRAEGIDILIETSGLTIGHRMGVLARRCAPVQVTYCGYPNTTGVPAIDRRIVDSITDPPGAESRCVERLHRLDRCFLCYRPPDEAGPVSFRPVGGPVTFGSFNAAVKLNGRLLGLWADVLRAVPGSTLILKSFDFRDATLRADVSHRIAGRGVDPARIRILDPTASIADHLRVYEQADIALDTCPYHGTTTTLEALWMGVPVVTLAGTLHAGRVGVSLLTALGLQDLIAADQADYVKIAAGLATDETKRAELRRTLRPRMAASALCDGRAFSSRFERALRAMWREWCGTKPREPGVPPLQ